MKKQKGTKKRIRKYKGGKANRPGKFDSVVVSEKEPVVPMNIGEEVPIINPPVNLDEAFIQERSFDSENDNEEEEDGNNNVFVDLYTDLHPQELGLEGGSKKSTFKSTFYNFVRKVELDSSYKFPVQFGAYLFPNIILFYPFISVFKHGKKL